MATQRPPQIPPGVPPEVADYLRRLTLWAVQEMDKKMAKDEPVQQLMLFPVTQKTPNVVWGIVVDDSGAVAVQSVPLGGPNPAHRT